jgi:hypothetical protein
LVSCVVGGGEKGRRFERGEGEEYLRMYPRADGRLYSIDRGRERVRVRRRLEGCLGICFALLEAKTELFGLHFEELEKYTNKTSNNLVDHICKTIS